MPTAQINIKFYNEATGNKKSDSVKVADGSFYNVPIAMRGQLQPNGNYTVEFTEKDGTGQWLGRKFRDITKIVSTQTASPSSGGKYGPTDDATAERIFVCGALNASIQAGQVNVGDGQGVLHAVQTLRTVWKRSFGPQTGTTPIMPAAPKPTTGQQFDEEVGDSIPF